MKNPLSFRFCVAATAIANLAFLVACGDETTQINQTGVEVVDSLSDLPKCTSNNDGSIAYVKGETSARICVEGEWFAAAEAAKDTVYVSGDFSCKTEELKDKSGLKIVCNGDSIGVVLNGSAGKDGKNGAAGTGCSVVDRTDSTVTVACGDSTMVMPLGSGAGEPLELDSEKVAVSMDSLAGFSQKGPFLKGSTVYLYELSDGRTLKQTNGNFTSIITRDDGRYKFTARDLASQYAMIVVEGYYRNEVTGNPSNAAIRLRALTDMRKRSSANVNLLTHLEFDRVYYLVTREKMTVKKAKAQAQKEILNAFLIDTTGFVASAEDLDVFGSSDADAALLAISILLQGDGNETDLSVLLTEIAADIETDGKWNGEKSDSIRANIADWAAGVDTTGKTALYRQHVEDWHLSENSAPLFERYVRMFWGNNWGLGVCGSDSTPVGTVRHAANSRVYFANDYLDTSKTKVRFICVDADSARWRPATNLEKDTAGLGHNFKNGDLHYGQINKNMLYVYEDGNWRHGSKLDSIIDVGCVETRKDTVAQGSDGVWYKCVDKAMQQEESSWNTAWREATNIEKDTATWGHDFEEGAVRNGQVNSSFVYVYEKGNWRLGDSMDSLLAAAGGKGCVLDNDTSTVKYNNRYYVCKAQSSGDVPRKWVVAPEYYNDTYEARGGCKSTGTYGDGTILTGRVNTTKKYVCDAGEFRLADSTEIRWNRGCVSYIRGNSVRFTGLYSYKKCTEKGWKYDFDRLNKGTLYDSRDGKTYKTIGINTQMWMAENLRYVPSTGSYCYDNEPSNCDKYGRLYKWTTAVGKTDAQCYGTACNFTGHVQGVCPSGWHLPTQAEWMTLRDDLDPVESGDKGAGLLAKGYNSSRWANATDVYGFSVLPAGGCYNSKTCYELESSTQFWTSEQTQNTEMAYWVYYSYYWTTGSNSELYQVSVRCVKN